MVTKCMTIYKPGTIVKCVVDNHLIIVSNMDREAMKRHDLDTFAGYTISPYWQIIREDHFNKSNTWRSMLFGRISRLDAIKLLKSIGNNEE